MLIRSLQSATLATTSKRSVGPRTTVCCTRLPSRRRPPACQAAGASRRYAVVGAGFAGAAAAWHLMEQSSRLGPTEIHLYDVAGLAGGASGAAAGLLHPFSPTGKVLWKGEEAMQAALQLVAAAEAAASRAGCQDLFVWRQSMVRLAATAKQSRQFEKACKQLQQQRQAGAVQSIAASPITVAEARDLLPGLSSSAFDTADLPEGSVAGLLIQGGLVLHPSKYIRAVWEATKQMAEDAKYACRAELHAPLQVHSLEWLQQEHGPFNAVLCAAGAAAGMLPEIGKALPVDLCQGYILDLELPCTHAQAEHQGGGGGSSSSKVDADSSRLSSARQQNPPSLLGGTYLAMQGPGSLAAGATKRSGLTSAQALAACSSPSNSSTHQDRPDVAALRTSANARMPELESWRLASVRSGVRAMPGRTPQGAMPYAGLLPLSNGSNRQALSPLTMQRPVICMAVHQSRVGIPSHHHSYAHSVL
ncbi:hypothetical protein WJX84_004137 [Apatococcus fuscideae]|uniref:FAD dependent oxidoreductase domain-containing protein n=1 Tax=Apatococcus fuscideae TaxID=2026836 RepID=A0AAW1S943_9CHLO